MNLAQLFAAPARRLSPPDGRSSSPAGRAPRRRSPTPSSTTAAAAGRRAPSRRSESGAATAWPSTSATARSWCSPISRRCGWAPRCRSISPTGGGRSPTCSRTQAAAPAHRRAQLRGARRARRADERRRRSRFLRLRSWRRAASDRRAPPAGRRRRGDDLAMLLYTSGTTGAARARCSPTTTCSPRSPGCWRPGPGRRRPLLLTLPLFHTHGLVVGLLAPWPPGPRCCCAAASTPPRRSTELAARRGRPSSSASPPCTCGWSRSCGDAAAAPSTAVRLFCSRQRAARAGDLRRLPRAHRPRHPRALRDDRDRHAALQPLRRRAAARDGRHAAARRLGAHRGRRRPRRPAGRRGRAAGARQQRLRRLLARRRRRRPRASPPTQSAGAGSAPATSARLDPATGHFTLLGRAPRADPLAAASTSTRARSRRCSPPSPASRGGGRRPAAPASGARCRSPSWSSTAALDEATLLAHCARELARFKVPRRCAWSRACRATRWARCRSTCCRPADRLHHSMKPAPFEYVAPDSLEEALAVLGGARRRRQAAGRRPEPDSGDELPARAAGAADRPQPRRRARPRRADGRRRPAHRRDDAAAPARARSRRRARARRSSPRRRRTSPIRRSATAARSAAASRTPTRPPSCRRWRWRSTRGCGCEPAAASAGSTAGGLLHRPVRHRAGARRAAGRDRVPPPPPRTGWCVPGSRRAATATTRRSAWRRG